MADLRVVIAGSLAAGALAARGGLKVASRSALAAACLLAVMEGVGIGLQRMMAKNTQLDVGLASSPFHHSSND